MFVSIVGHKTTTQIVDNPSLSDPDQAVESLVLQGGLENCWFAASIIRLQAIKLVLLYQASKFYRRAVVQPTQVQSSFGSGIISNGSRLSLTIGCQLCRDS